MYGWPMTQYLSEIDAALDRNDTIAAARIAEQALQAGGQEPILFNLAAWLREEEGDLEKAEELLRAALKRDPEDPTLLVGLGVVLRKQGRLKLAVDSFDAAIRIDPAYPSCWYERGSTFERGGSISDAGDDYRQALRLEPQNPLFLAALATVNARLGDLGQARELADKALRIDPATPAAHRALAQAALEERRYEEALEILGKQELTMDDAGAGLHTLRGDALEGLGRFDEAFEAYLSGKTAFLKLHEERMVDAGPEELLVRLEQSAANLKVLAKSAWIKSDPPLGSGPDRHIFLTGHPRSGTTLAENILASLPNAVAIEERPTIAGLGSEILGSAEGFGTFARLPETRIEALRDDYWSRASSAVGTALSGKLFIDMDPFKGTRLPYLARLFPKAKYVITRRDPRDVVWSCFHTNFAFNAGTAMFGTLENTARHYAATWSIIEETLGSLPLDWIELRYESLVRDFDETTQALCSFLDVPWSEDVRQFDRTAKRRGVSTASATQVRQGLYDGSGGWRRYEQQLSTVEPILRPWIERFGYV